jgi:hypothetical protein
MLNRFAQPRTWLVLGLLVVLAVVVYAIAISGRGDATLAASVDEPALVVEVDEPAVEGQAAQTDAEADEPPVEGQAAQTDVEAAEPVAAQEVTILTEDDRPSRLRNATNGWATNWNKHTIDYGDLLSGGPPRDGIPSIDDPQFISPDAAAEWLAGNEPVIALEIGDEARAYPLQILTWHEIVNDVVADVPVAVTFCPLCNSAITFDRRLDGETYEFGTSGLLRHSDLVMYDRTTEGLWQQFTGEAIAGDLAGRQLTFLASSIVSFADFREAHPEGVVLSRDTGFNRRYGQNPYVGYDNIGSSPFLFRGEIDGRLAAVERVVTVSLEPSTGSGQAPSTGSGQAVDVAYPLTTLSELGVINDSQGGRDLVVFHTSGTSSALGAGTIATAEDVGATGVFDPVLDDQKLIFQHDGDTIVDAETGSTWNILGQAIDGPLAGEQLEPIVHADHFWFSWAAFKPDTIIYSASN